MVWDDEAKARLIALLGEGKTHAQIADAMGFTKNAISAAVKRYRPPELAKWKCRTADEYRALSHLSVHEVAAEFGVHVETVRDAAKAHGIEFARAQSVASRREADYRALSHLTRHQAASRLGVSVSSVDKAAARYGIEYQTATGRPKGTGPKLKGSIPPPSGIGPKAMAEMAARENAAARKIWYG